MQQHELRPPRGAKKARKRVGRGDSSGHGTYSGKGIKGQQSRSGYKTKPWFEGGQTPMIRRLPHRRGFRNPFRIEFVPINFRDLERISGTEVTPESIRDAGLTRSLRQPIKILADGELNTALTVKVHRVSASAKEKIEAAGGTVEELIPRKDRSQRTEHRKRQKKSATPAAAASDGDEGEAADEGANKEPAADASPADDENQDGE